MDITLALLAITVAFLASSFVARNSDFWRHIGTGRALLTGNYSLGSDPLTYTGEARPWVNFNWLAEVGMYLLYSLDNSGAVVLAVKAMFFAGAFAVLFLLRKPTMPLLPWAVAILLACVGAAPFAMLRPYVLGLGFFAVLLVLLFRGNWTKGEGLRMPLITGGLVVLWTNCDNYSFIAPLAVFLLALGETIHAKIFAGRLELPEDEDPLLRLPPTRELWITAGVCAVAMLLNPTFLLGLTKNPGEAIAQLVPLELDWSTCEELGKHNDLKRQTYSLLNNQYMDNPLLGKNLPTYTSLAVVILCAISMALGYRHGRASHVMLWTVLCLLAMIVHAKFIGFAMIASAPFLAANLNGLLISAFKRGVKPDTERLLILGSVVGRVVALIVMPLTILAAFPGWLQANVPTTGYARTVGWGVDAEVNGHRRSAELLQEWRTTDGKKDVLKDVRGIQHSPEFADFCAYFAPAEKGLLNSRLTFHRHELPDLLTIRESLSLSTIQKNMQAISTGTFDFSKLPIQEVMQKHKATYFSISTYTNHMSGQTLNAVSFALASQTPQGTKLAEYWHLDGRFAVAARPTEGMEELSKTMRWQPGTLLFGKPGAQPVPESEVIRGIPPLEGWAYELLFRQQPQPLESFDALTFHELGDILRGQLEEKQIMALQRNRFLDQSMPSHVMVGGGAGWASKLALPQIEIQLGQDDMAFALPLLTIKQANAAVAKNPNDPNGYFAQALAYQTQFNPDLTMLPGQPSFRDTAILTGLNRAIARLPAKEQLSSSKNVVVALTLRQALLEAYFRQGLTDAARVELREIIDIRTAAGEKAAGYDSMIPQLWENTLFISMKQQVGQRLQQLQGALTKELQDAGGKPGPDLQRKLGSFQQTAAMFQQDPISALVQMKLLDEKDHPKNFYKALQGRGKSTDEDGPTENKVVEGLAIRQLVRLNELLSKDEQQLVENLKRNIPSGAPAASVFRAFIENGLPIQAIKFFNDQPENSRDVSFQVSYMELLYRLGKIEPCHTEVFAPEAFDPATQRDPQIIERLTVLRLQRELLLGDYFKADQTAMQLLQTQFIPLTEAEKVLATTDLMNTQFAVGQLLGMLPFLEYERQRGALVNRLVIEANLTFRRGVMCLLRSDLPEAKRLFDLAAQPQGIPLEKLGLSDSPDMSVLLPKYRELLKKYAK